MLPVLRGDPDGVADGAIELAGGRIVGLDLDLMAPDVFVAAPGRVVLMAGSNRSLVESHSLKELAADLDGPIPGKRPRPNKTDRAALDGLGARLVRMPASSKPRLAGTLEIKSGCLAILDPGVKPTVTRAKLAAASKKPLESKAFVAVPLEHGRYDVFVPPIGVAVDRIRVRLRA